MRYKLKVYSIWEYGQRTDSQGNPHQEDSMFPEYGKQSDNDRLFILCDGMGGHDAGEVASATVCEAMSRYILDDGHNSEGTFSREDFLNAIRAAFDALDKNDSGAVKKMGTTMTFLKLHSKGATIAHIGDSRVYQIRPGKTGADTKIIFQTEDHSLVNDLIKIGELTKEEARHSRQKNVITRAMQPNMEHRPKADIYDTADIKAGDYFYMCSDGMLEQSEMESGESLKNIFSGQGGPDENKVEILKSVTEKNRDNHTAFIIHILEVEYTEDPVKDKSSLALDDKFTAIVEDDDETNYLQYDNGSSRQSVNDTAKDDPDDINEPQNTAPAKSEEAKPNAPVKSRHAFVIRLIAAVIVILAIIVVFYAFKSCSNNKDDKGGEKIEQPAGKHTPQSAPPKRPDRKPTNATTGESPEHTPEQTAVEAANSSAANQLETPEQPTQAPSQNPPHKPISESSAIQIPSTDIPDDGVVNSDQQVIQQLTN